MSDDEDLATFRQKRREEERKNIGLSVDDDPELASIRQQTKHVQQDSLESTRRALSKIKETEKVGTKTSEELRKQGGIHIIEAINTAKNDHRTIG